MYLTGSECVPDCVGVGAGAKAASKVQPDALKVAGKSRLSPDVMFAAKTLAIERVPSLHSLPHCTASLSHSTASLSHSTASLPHSTASLHCLTTLPHLLAASLRCLTPLHSLDGSV